jgi:hypothetical protein
MKDKGPKNHKSFLGFMGKFIPVLGSEWGFAKMNAKTPNCKIAFPTAGLGNIIAISPQGQFYWSKFNGIKGGNCKNMETTNILTKIRKVNY